MHSPGNERMLSMSLPIANFKDLFCFLFQNAIVCCWPDSADLGGAAIGSYLGYTGRDVDGVATAACDPEKSYASSSNGSNFGWNQICAMRVGTTALPMTAVSRMVY